MRRPEMARVAALEERRPRGRIRPPMVLLAWLLSVVAAHGQKSAVANLPTLTHVEQIKRMTIEEAARGYPVRLRGVVTYYNWDLGDLFVQDSTAGIWVNPGQTRLALHQGELVEIEGLSGVGELASDIEPTHFRSLGEAPMPTPRKPTSDELASGRLDSQWIELRGVVRSVAERGAGLVLNVSSGAFECPVFVLNYPSLPTDIVDAQVRVRGVFAGLYDPSSVRMIGFQVLTPSWSDVEVLEKPTQAFWSEPLRPIRLLLRLTPEGAFTHRVRVRGVVTLQQLGRSLCLRDSEGALLVNTTQPTPLKVGDVIDAVGYPAIGDYTVIMRDAIFRRVGEGPTPQPVVVRPEELRAGTHNADLVRLSARLLNGTTQPGEQLLRLQAGEVPFKAVLETTANSSPLGSLRVGSLLQLTGVSIIEANENHEAKGFEVHLRSPADVIVLELPSWWTPRRALRVLGLLGVVVILALGWVAALRRRVRRQTEALRLKYERELALEEQYRDLFENANDLILCVDPQGRFLYVNPAWRKTLGYSAEEAGNLSLFDIVHPRWQEHFLLLFRRLMSGEKIARVEVEFMARSGETVVLEGSCDCKFGDGKPVSTRGIFRDVSERKRAEDALRRSEQFNREVIASAREGVIVYDREFRYRVWNRFMEDLSGVPASQVLGKQGFKIFPHLREQKVDVLLQRALQGEVVQSPDMPFRVPFTGKSGWVSCVFNPHFGPNGDIIGVINIVHDITERRRAEEALRESEARYRGLFENALEGIGVSRGNEVINANRALLDIFGYSDLEEFAAIPLLEHVAPQSRELIKEMQEKLGRGEPHPKRFEYQITRKDGETRTLEVSTDAVYFGGERYTQSTFRDITERKRTEEALIEERHLLHTLMDNLPDHIYFKDLQSRFIRLNKAMTKWFRLSDPAQALGKTDFDIFSDEHAKQAYSDEQEIIRTGQPMLATEEKETWPDGRETWVSTTKMALRDAQGRIVGTFGISRDITARKRAEEALRESETRFRAVFENAAIGITLVDMDGHAVESNPAFQKMLGYSAPELAQMAFSDYTHPDDALTSREPFAELCQGKRDRYQLEKRYCRKDGQIVWGQLTVSLVRNQNGEPRYAIGMIEDISERKRAEEALRESEARFRAVFENAAIGVALVDMDGHPVESNPAFQKMLGYSAPELAQMVITDYTHRDDAQVSREQFADLCQGKRDRYQLEKRYFRKDGQIVWGQLTSSLVRNQNGEPRYAIGMIEDISERKRAEEALRESEERHRSFIENVPLGVYRTTPDGRVLMANSAMLRMLGYDSQQDLASRNLEAEGFEAGYPRIAFREQLERQGEVRGLEANWKRRDGSVVSVRESAKAVRAEDGRVLYYDGTIEDISERRRLEEQLRQAQKMEAVGRLAAGVAHDFNNLLTIVIGFSDLALQRLSAGNRMRSPLEEIKKAGERAAWLTRQLLAFSRKQVLQPQILDLNSLLTNVDRMLRRVIGEDIELVMHLPPGLGRVKADPGQIEQVIMNLAVNARDAMPQGGQLMLEAANVELDSGYASSHQSVLPGHYVMFALSDTGIGMDSKTQAHIFEPFFTTKEPGKGTGLGLSTVYGIVKQSSGYIWVYSEPGKGATFKVYLPRIDHAVEAIASGEPGVGELARASETILLVEDEKAVRSLAREILECRGYRVLETEGAMEALEVGARHKGHIHLLLTDVVMPQMGGRELADHLAPLHPETRVLYMSGYADNAVVHHGLLDPGTALLQKPFTAQALAAKLREVLDNAGEHAAGVTTCPPTAPRTRRLSLGEE